MNKIFIPLMMSALLGCSNLSIEQKPAASDTESWWRADREVLLSKWGRVFTHTNEQDCAKEYDSSLNKTVRLIREGKPVVLGVLGQPIVSGNPLVPYQGDKPYIMDLPTEGVGDADNPISDAEMLAERRVVAWYDARGIYPVNSLKRKKP